MKKFLVSFILTTTVTVAALTFGQKAFAITEHTGEKNKDVVVENNVSDDFYVASDKNLTIKGSIGGDLFGVGGNVKIEKEVNGDLYLVGGKVDVEKAVNGNVFITGGEVNLKGQIFGSVYVVGGEVKIDGNVVQDVMVISGQVHINGQVMDDVRVFAGQADIKDVVQGDVIVYAGQTNIEGDVYGDVLASSGEVKIDSKYIGGDLTVYKNTKLTLNSTTELMGEKVVKDTNWGGNDAKVNVNGFSNFGVFAFVGKLFWNMSMGIGFIILGLIAYKFTPVKFDKTLAQMNGIDQNLKSFGVGCLALPFGIIVSLILLVSVVGWPLLGVLLALAFIAKIMVGIYVGTKFGIWLIKPLKSSHPVVFGMIIGIFLLQLVTVIPFLGGIVGFFVFFIGLGALIRAWYFRYSHAKASLKPEKYNEVKAETKSDRSEKKVVVAKSGSKNDNKKSTKKGKK